MKRETGFYWVKLAGWGRGATVARWDGIGWLFATKPYAAAVYCRVRKVLSERLTPPSQVAKS